MEQTSNQPRVTPMLTTSEVAVILNVHINTVRRWSSQGTLKSYQLGPRGDRRFRREDIDAFLSGHTRQPDDAQGSAEQGE